MDRLAFSRTGDAGAPSHRRPGSARLAALRAQVAAMEGDGFKRVGAARPGWTPSGSPSQGVAPGRGADRLAVLRAEAGLHDLRPASYLDAPAAYQFAARWLAALPEDRLIVWVRARGEARLDFGTPCPDGLQGFGIDPGRVLLVTARPGGDALWAMEEAAKSGALVLGEAGRHAGYDLTASRRLHQAAREQSGAVLVIRAHDAQGTSAALTRWRIAARPGRDAPWRGAGGLQGLASARLHAVLERRRGGPPDDFELEWSEHALCGFEPAALAGRAPARAAAR